MRPSLELVPFQKCFKGNRKEHPPHFGRLFFFPQTGPSQSPKSRSCHWVISCGFRPLPQTTCRRFLGGWIDPQNAGGNTSETHRIRNIRGSVQFSIRGRHLQISKPSEMPHPGINRTRVQAYGDVDSVRYQKSESQENHV